MSHEAIVAAKHYAEEWDKITREYARRGIAPRDFMYHALIDHLQRMEITPAPAPRKDGSA